MTKVFLVLLVRAAGRELELEEARLDLRLQSRLSLDETRDRDGFLQGREYLTKGRFFLLVLR